MEKEESPWLWALGSGSQLQAPMALVIIGGQVVGTVLLLGVNPALYLVFNTSPRQWLGGRESLTK